MKKVNAIQTINVGDLVKKAAYNKKLTKLEKLEKIRNHDTYSTTKEFNKLLKQN